MTIKTTAERKKEVEELYAKGPVKRGPYYCSPWCGHNCTIIAYDAAGFKAKALAEQLGPNWKPHVWENLGWHYQAVDSGGKWSVSCYEHDGKIYYGATLANKWVDTGKTPQQAIENVKHRALQALEELQAIIDESLVNSEDLYFREKVMI